MSHNVYNEIFDPIIYEKVNSKNKELLAEFVLNLKENRRSSTTIRQYEFNLRNLFCDIYRNYENKFILELTKKDLRKYALSLIEERHLSNSRRNCLISTMRCLLFYAETDEDWNYNINASRLIKGLTRETVKPIVFLDDGIVLRLFDILTKMGELQKAAILLLAYDCAGRRSELAQVKKDGFLDLSRNNTNVVIGKGRKKFSLIYFNKTREAVLNWLEKRGEDNVPELFITEFVIGEKHPADGENVYAWFVSMRKLLTELNGLEKDFGPHSMRHSSLKNYKDGSHYVCKELELKGFPIDQLQVIAHHSSSQTTQSYLPDTSNEELNNMFRIKIK
jgi:integrase